MGVECDRQGQIAGWICLRFICIQTAFFAQSDGRFCRGGRIGRLLGQLVDQLRGLGRFLSCRHEVPWVAVAFQRGLKGS